MYKKYILYTILLLILPIITFSQEELQVVSKAIEETYSYSVGKVVKIEGERSDIEVKTWLNKQIKVKITFSSKHLDRQTAILDLEKIKYAVSNETKQLLIRNYILSASDKLQSNLKAQYEILVPEDCIVEITNYFGKMNVNDLGNNLTVDAQFSPVSLANLRGEIDINSKFGDIIGENIKGKVLIKSHRSDVTLKNLEGKYNISSKYGIVKIFADRSLLDLKIDADNSDVYFFHPEPSSFGYELLAHYGSITTPNDLKINYKENSKILKHASFTSTEQNQFVSIKINFGDLVIRNSRP